MRRVALIQASWREPARVLSAFAEEPWAIGFLSDGMGARGRWSYLAREPDAVLWIDANAPDDAFAALARMLGPPLAGQPDGPPFQGGVAGLCAYGLAARIEPLGLAHNPDWPDLACGRYPAVLAFDHQNRLVTATGRGDDDGQAKANAERALSWLAADARPRPGVPPAGPMACDPPADYERAVTEVVGRIAAGEIFQANIARAWRGRLKPGARPFDLLDRLMAASPAPFAAYLRLDRHALVSNSPERFVRVDRQDGGLRAETRPIKGTAPRGHNGAEDAELARALSASVKDRAENLMIVDLMRNDLARVCAPGTVATTELFRVETFANVHHLVSTVIGRLAPGRTAVDLLRGAFPPGSITGAPKVQAMKVIGELEPPRGPFFGALFWAGFDGAFDSSVLIRTAAFTAEDTGWRVEARAGGGIVADSDPAAERRETEAKIAALLAALNGA
jgi:para-aminobenzoate synthetase component 1